VEVTASAFDKESKKGDREKEEIGKKDDQKDKGGRRREERTCQDNSGTSRGKKSQATFPTKGGEKSDFKGLANDPAKKLDEVGMKGEKDS